MGRMVRMDPKTPSKCLDYSGLSLQLAQNIFFQTDRPDPPPPPPP